MEFLSECLAVISIELKILQATIESVESDAF